MKINKQNFSIEQISESGQCFRLNKIEENRYALIASGQYLEIVQKQDELIFSCSPEEYKKHWCSYFDLDTDYGSFIASIAENDAYLSGAAAYGEGIRILRQDLWEMVVSFIISQQNNIKRIKKGIELLCENFGEEKYSPSGVSYRTFPTAQALSKATEEELRLCNLGYRSRYLLRTAESILKQEVDLEAIKSMSYPEAKAELLKLYGVGEKVADCICLYGLHHLEAFPVDTHIRQALDRHYPEGFPFTGYTGYEGVLQQYIFYYDLKFKNSLP